ncbi:MAG: ATP phosphoribosyltransferase [Gammaproteobacteria bacterium]|nr:ATP phosphoribosyltransferase [Gammaproteobacteria bacterium]MDH3506072.1 ATP phosphoribosyltransferase [Gammaproteobacteria bacterium]
MTTQQQQNRIKIAVQKSGRLTEHSMDLLVRCGLTYSRGRDQLICYGENMPVDVLLVRDDDIPGLVQEDICDLGIVGGNIAEEVRLDLETKGETELFQKVYELDYGHCRLSFGLPEGSSFDGPQSLNGKRIATSYPNIVSDYLRRNNVTASVVEFSGAVEIAPSLGKSDLICDLVSSGATLRAHHLFEAETILESKAVLIQTPKGVPEEKADWIRRLLQRVQGVLQVRESKYIMLHAPRSALKKIRALLPGSEAPTIMPLEGRDDKVALHAVCRENVFWETLEQLKEAGASSMLVLPVEKMLD